MSDSQSPQNPIPGVGREPPKMLEGLCLDNTFVFPTAEFENIMNECILGKEGCKKLKELYRILHPLRMVKVGILVLLTEKMSLTKIRNIINAYAPRRWLKFRDIFNFSLLSEYAVGGQNNNVYGAYWLFTSTTTLHLPFVIKAKFVPKCNDVKMLWYFIGSIIAESDKGGTSSFRFKRLSTTHPVSLVTYLCMARYFLDHGVKVYIKIYDDEVSFIFHIDVLKPFIERLYNDPTILSKLSDEAFLYFLAGLLTGDGTISLHNSMIVGFSGNYLKERKMYKIIAQELKRRFGIQAYLSPNDDENNTSLRAHNTVTLQVLDENAVKLLKLLPDLVEPLKQVRKETFIRRGHLSLGLIRWIFELTGSEKKKRRTKGIRKLQSNQAVRFLRVLIALKLIELKQIQPDYYQIVSVKI